MTRSLSRRAALALAGVFFWICASPAWSVPPTADAPTAEAPTAAEAGAAYVPRLIETNAEQQQAALQTARVPEGFTREIVAYQPLIANPVAFCFDPQGRCYVAETFRQGKGVEDNRNHMNWLNNDLAAQTVADRRAFFEKHLGDKLKSYTEHDDRIRLLEDRDGDGRYEHVTTFAEGFNDVTSGTGAGVLYFQGDVYYTCIPDLWRLRDANGDGRADERESLHTGYGVRVAFRGHDMHGLIVGPDGKVYYSIGDRGYHIVTPEGTLADPESGAVFRCNPDGSELEVFATGLRNPQELAFDKYGNLFTGDNNSDSGDRARWVYVVEGGDTGWRMAYQYLSDRGPWNREKLWHPYHAEQPAYIVPPIANFANGPSGLTYYPGTGLAEKYNDHFFMAEFRGGSGNSGILSFAVELNGASFKLGPVEETIWSVLATDVEFGPDSKLYVADWVNGWNGDGQGRLWRFADAEAIRQPIVAETKTLLAEGMASRQPAELAKLLAHQNMQVRLAAQFELAGRGPASLPLLQQVAAAEGEQLARIHAMWALGQLARQAPAALATLPTLLNDADDEIRAQAAKLLAQSSDPTQATELLLARLKGEENARVKFFAAQSLGKLKQKSAVTPLAEVLRENEDQDPMLRHAAVMGLTGTADTAALLALAADPSRSVRLGALLALRRQGAPEIAWFLNDTDPFLIEEAARAIHDLPIPTALPALAQLADRAGLTSDALLRRVLNANYRLGGAAEAQAVARFAARTDAPESLRIEAINILGDWTEPVATDRVLNLWRPLATRSAEIGVEALRAALPSLMTSSEGVRQAGAQTAAKLGIREIGPALAQLVEDATRPVGQRVAALEALVTLNDPQLETLMRQAIDDQQPALRAAGRHVLAKRHPEEAAPALEAALSSGELVERQAALAALATLPGDAANTILTAWMEKLLRGDAPAELHLDLLEASAKRNHPALQAQLAAFEKARASEDPLAAYREALVGGDAERGREIFFQRVQVSCVRCHAVDAVGGEVGPDLSKIAREKQREYLLEAIVDPNRTIAKGFGTVMLLTDEGQVVSGIVKQENDESLRLITAEGKLIDVAKDTIDERQEGQSAMPGDLVKHLSKADVRDLVEFLARCK